MPTYEYACKSCGQHLDVVQSFTDDPLTECPNCGGVLRKVFGNIGISFKGSGFYKNDSRSTTSSTTPSTTGSSSASDGGSSSSDGGSSSSADSGSSSSASDSSKSAATPAAAPAKKEAATSK